MPPRKPRQRHRLRPLRLPRPKNLPRARAASSPRFARIDSYARSVPADAGSPGLSLIALGIVYRRHRHESAVRAASVLRSRVRPRGVAAERLRRAVADRVDAHHRGEHQVHRLHHAGRQSGRRRDPRPARVAAAAGAPRRGSAPSLAVDLVRTVRRGTALRRRHHHARPFRCSAPSRACRSFIRTCPNRSSSSWR